MTIIGKGCHELRINSWRIVYAIRSDEILLLGVFAKKTRRTPHQIVETCRRRLRHYEGVR